MFFPNKLDIFIFPFNLKLISAIIFVPSGTVSSQVGPSGENTTDGWRRQEERYGSLSVSPAIPVAQLKTVMLSQMSPEYLFKTIDPPNVAEKKFKPRRALIVAAGLMLGMTLGLLASVLYFHVRPMPCQRD